MENGLTETNAQTQTGIERRLIWPALLGLLVFSIAFVAIPVFLIQPFRPQTQRALEISYLLRSWSPLTTAIMLLAALALVIWRCRQPRRWWRKTLLVIFPSLSLVSAWFARQIHFERLFTHLLN